MNINKRNKEASSFVLMQRYSKNLVALKNTLIALANTLISEHLDIENIELKNLGVKTYSHKAPFDLIHESVKDNYPFKCNIKLAFYCENDLQIDYVLYNLQEWCLECPEFMLVLDEYAKEKQQVTAMFKYVNKLLKDKGYYKDIVIDLECYYLKYGKRINNC